MRLICAFLLSTTTAFAASSPTPRSAVLAPRDAAELLQLLGSSDVKGSDVPEVYRLEALLSQIAQSPSAQQQAPQQAEIEKPLSEREAEHAPK